MRAAGMAVCVALLTSAAAIAHESAAPLPQMAQCQTPSPPLLPDKWRATFLMAPFART
jgi:hypothetical protein